MVYILFVFMLLIISGCDSESLSSNSGQDLDDGQNEDLDVDNGNDDLNGEDDDNGDLDEDEENDGEVENVVIFCEIDDDCVLSSVSNDPNLEEYSFLGKKGYGISAENIEVACMSKSYFEDNKELYHLQTYSADFQIWTGGESNCKCEENKCKDSVYGMIVV